LTISSTVSTKCAFNNSVQAGYAWAVADLSPLDFWEGDEYKPLTISGSC